MEVKQILPTFDMPTRMTVFQLTAANCTVGSTQLPSGQVVTTYTSWVQTDAPCLSPALVSFASSGSPGCVLSVSATPMSPVDQVVVITVSSLEALTLGTPANPNDGINLVLAQVGANIYSAPLNSAPGR